MAIKIKGNAFVRRVTVGEREMNIITEVKVSELLEGDERVEYTTVMGRYDISVKGDGLVTIYDHNQNRNTFLKVQDKLELNPDFVVDKYLDNKLGEGFDLKLTKK